MQNIKVVRSELKYYISHKEYTLLKQRLRHILKKDRDTHPLGGYFIRSLYFDSIDDEALFDKNSGIYKRAKYRLRLYDPKSEKLKFEIKNKINNQILKETAIISKKSAQEIIRGNYEELLRYNNEILNRIYGEFKTKIYRPKVIVDYIREAYLYDNFNIRITFDKFLRSSVTNLEIFNKELQTIPLFFEPKMILEIKYNKYLPSFIQDMLQIEGFERAAISKYALSRTYFKRRKWEDN